MWDAAAITGRRRLVLRTASTAFIAGALIVPAVGHSDVDRSGPSAPTAVEVIDASSTSVTITWKAGHGRPVLEFALYRDGERVAATVDTTYAFTGLSCGTTYTLGVEAVDSSGNHSERASLLAAPDPCPMPELPPPPVPPPAPVPPEPPAQPPVEPPPAPAVPAPPAELEPDPLPQPDALPQPGTPSGEMSWRGAGAFVWHETDVAPETLGRQLRANGFSWVAVLVHDGLAADPIERDWVRRFRAASGLFVGGWGVLRTEPEPEAELAHRLLDSYRLDFYIANAEAEYKLSNDDGPSRERFGRSQRFVDRFRALEPDTPSAVSSYCRADRQDIDWKAWSGSGFAFLPQSYVNDFGIAVSPAACAEGATAFFPADAVHPTIGVYASRGEVPSPEQYAALLHEAGTVGFSVYLAETRMYARDWNTFGRAIAELEIARVISDAPGGSRQREQTPGHEPRAGVRMTSDRASRAQVSAPDRVSWS